MKRVLVLWAARLGAAASTQATKPQNSGLLGAQLAAAEAANAAAAAAAAAAALPSDPCIPQLLITTPANEAAQVRPIDK